MSEPSITHSKIAGLILAGGQSRRMQGQDKGLQMLNGQMLVAHVIARLRPQLGQVWLCANRHLSQYETFDLPVFSDETAYLGMGPLAGIASFTAHLPDEYTHVQIAPCDTPFLPADLSARLYAAACAHDALAVYPQTTEGAHYSCALLHRSLLASAASHLHHDLNNRQGQRSLHRWLAQHRALAVAGFDEADFANINTPEQLQSHTEHTDFFGANHA